MRSFEIASDLAAKPDTVWQHVVTPAGINDELMPLMRMTMPRHLRGATIDQLPLRQRVGRCWMWPRQSVRDTLRPGGSGDIRASPPAAG